ncbi:AsmA family protein [Mucilaginibacter sp. PAMC 26640]|nr:AsmA family protein [Mucilaginibacter sp. PAMC 26640]
MPKWLKISLKILGALLLLLILIIVGVSVYIANNKKEVLAKVTQKLNENIDGTLSVSDINTSFFSNFPDASLKLKNVVIRDRQFPRHKHTLLNAKDFDVSVNAGALLHGVVSINNVSIHNAAIDLYTDSTGYSNTAVFKKNKKDTVKAHAGENSNSSTQLKKFGLNNVSFTINNQKANKLFNFQVNDLEGKMTYPDTGWHASVHLDVLAKSLAFNTKKGSFIKDRRVVSDLEGGYNEASGKINVHSDAFKIGDDSFGMNTLFVTGKGADSFTFHFTNDKLQWRSASSLLAANISKTLNRFNIEKPIKVDALISGSFGGGDPYFRVSSEIKDNRVTVPGAIIDDCNFNALFTNENVKGKGLTDENSVIRLTKFSGTYSDLPFNIDSGSITNLAVPIATGNFRANFPVSKLNTVGSGVAQLSNGTVDMNLQYKADVINLKLNKPVVKGAINLKNANIKYIPRNLNLTNTSISMLFVGNDLLLKNIRLQSGKSIVRMEGQVKNFLNLYYSAPEKILINWQVTSPQIYLAEFIGFLGATKPSAPTFKTANSGNVVNQLAKVLNTAKADMHMRINELHYRKFLATDVNADLLMSEDGIRINGVSLKNAGGSLKLTGNLVQKGNLNDFIMATDVNNVDIRSFFESFDNFGLKDLTSQNLRGFLSAKTSTTGSITNTGDVVKHSIRGKVKIDLRNGALINYGAIKSVGKFVFPFRDLNNIQLKPLQGDFDIKGDKIVINPMEISSSVLNVDVAGIYGLTSGTDIALDIPLRNPEKDKEITDAAELSKRRFKGIVVHIRAHEENGKLKIGWNGNHK